MNITILTQDEPFYLARSLDYLLGRMPAHSRVVHCILLDPSPFGKRLSMAAKLWQTWRVFGTRFFAFYTFRFLTNRFNSANRVRRVLEKYDIPISDISGSVNSPESLELIRTQKPDLLVSIAGNQIFKKKLRDLAPNGCLNLHTALLPRYRGLMPSFWVLKNREKETGVSVFFMDEGIDSGPIIVQRKIEIGDMSQAELIRQSKIIGMDAIIEAVDKIEGGGYELIANDESQMTYFSFPTRRDVKDFYRAGKRFF